MVLSRETCANFDWPRPVARQGTKGVEMASRGEYFFQRVRCVKICSGNGNLKFHRERKFSRRFPLHLPLAAGLALPAFTQTQWQMTKAIVFYLSHHLSLLSIQVGKLNGVLWNISQYFNFREQRQRGIFYFGCSRNSCLSPMPLCDRVMFRTPRFNCSLWSNQWIGMRLYSIYS